MNQEIDQYITRFFNGTASSQEIDTLDQWLKKDRKNLQYFFKKRSLYEAEHPVFNPQQIDTEKAWLKLQLTVTSRKRFIVWKIAAAAVVILIICSTLLLPDKKQCQLEHLLPSESFVTQTISAVLTLPSGEKVRLNDTLSIQDKIRGAQINSNSIEYNSCDSNQQELVYHSLEVPRGGEFFLTLSDGSKIWINADSKVRYPIQFGAQERQIFVDGEIYLEVAKNTNAPFHVFTPQGEIIVLGTSFNVNTYQEEQYSLITLAEGAVKVKSTLPNKSITLKPGEQAILNHHDGSLCKKKVDISLHCSWPKGVITFKNNSLEEIMTRLARWYDLQVSWQHESLKKIKFSGEMKRYEEIGQLLKIISHTQDVKFIHKNKEIFILKP